MASQLNFSKNLKSLRTGANKWARKFSQQQIANELCIARSAISEYENGIKEPTLNVIAKIADFFEISLDELCR